MMLKYYFNKQLLKISKVKLNKIMELNKYRKLICAKQISFNSHRKLKFLWLPMYSLQTLD